MGLQIQREGKYLILWDMIVCNTFFKKRDSLLIAYTLRPSKTQIGEIMVQKKDRKRVRYVQDIPGEEVTQQHQQSKKKLNLCEIRKVWKEEG